MRGAGSEGLRSAVHPDSSAGAIFEAGIASGKFQGVMRPRTPMERREVIAQVRSSSADGRAVQSAALPPP